MWIRTQRGHLVQADRIVIFKAAELVEVESA